MRFAALLLFLFVIGALPASAQRPRAVSPAGNRVQTVAQPSDALARALASRDVSAFSQLCTEQVDLTLNGETTVYTRAQVAYVLDTWLDEYPPRLVRFTRHTDGVPGTLMASGTLVHDEGEVGVTARFVRSASGRWEVRALHLIER